MTLRGERIRRFWLLALCGAAWLLCAGRSEAANKGKRASPAVCEATVQTALNLSAAGHLREARERFRECTRPSCGAAVARQCTAHALDLESDIPTIVPVVTDVGGASLIDVVIKADGEQIASHLDGRGLPLDPGVHELSFSTRDLGVFATEKVMVVEGQRNRLITVATRKAAPPAIAAREKAAADADERASGGKEDPTPPSEPATPPPPATEPDATAPVPKRGRSALPFVLGGVGLASIGAGVLLTVWGNQDNAAMSSCRPNCIANDVTYIRQMYLASDIALGAGLGAVALAGVLFFTGRSSGDSRPAHTAYGLDVRPARSGAVVSVKATF